MTTAARRTPAVRPSPRVPGLVAALSVSVVVTAVAGSLAGATGGRAEVLGAVLGGGLVGLFFVFGTFSTALAAAYAPALSLFVALLTYTLQVAGLALVLAAVRSAPADRGQVDTRWLAGAVIAGTFAWTVTLVAGAVREVRSAGSAPVDNEAPEAGAGPAAGASGREEA